ncbi:MAG TPA: hypothetical protein VK669_11435 [Candidatus Limnocylindrales bacterium]|nr:hypothetical protein [Candidatus Limnocylindrales bacterium]
MSEHKRKGRILTTAAEMKRAALAAREREKTATKIRHVNYEPGRDALVVDLSTGVTLVVPRTLIPGFAKAAPLSLADVAIDPGAESLWSETVDDGVLLEQLVHIAAGDELLQVLGGRVAGRRRSPAKASAARKNGAKGGRPPFSMDQFIGSLDDRIHELLPDGLVAEISTKDDPGFPLEGEWRIGGRPGLAVKTYGTNEVHVTSAWRRRRTVERRIRATADRLAREFVWWLTERRRAEDGIRMAEAHAIRRRANAGEQAPPKRRRASATR